MHTRTWRKPRTCRVSALAAVIVLLLCGASCGNDSTWQCRMDVESGQVVVSGDPTLYLLSSGPDENRASVPFPLPAWVFRAAGLPSAIASREGVEPRSDFSTICWFAEDGEVKRTRVLEGEGWVDVSQDGSRILRHGPAAEHPDGTWTVDLVCETADGLPIFRRTMPCGMGDLAPDGNTFAWRPSNVRQTEIWTCEGERTAVIPGSAGLDLDWLDSCFSPSGERLAAIKSRKISSTKWAEALWVVTTTGDTILETDLGNVRRVRHAWHGEHLFIAFSTSGPDPNQPATLVSVDAEGSLQRVQLTELGEALDVRLCVSFDGEHLFLAIQPSYQATRWPIYEVSMHDLSIIGTVDLGDTQVLGMAAGPDSALAVLTSSRGEKTRRLFVLSNGRVVSTSDWPWRIRSISTSPDGSSLLLAGSDRYESWVRLHAMRWN